MLKVFNFLILSLCLRGIHKLGATKPRRNGEKVKELGLASFAAEEEIDIGMIEGLFQEDCRKKHGIWECGL